MVHQPLETLETLMSSASAGRIKRRDVLRRGLALGLSAPVLAALLAACGGDDEDPTATIAPTSAAAGDPTATRAEAAPSATEAGGEASATAAEATATTGSTDEPSPTSESSGQRGGGGALNILWWQAPVVLNGHLSVAGKDIGAILTCMEPLAYFGPDGQLVPYLAAEIPSAENGGLAEDFTSVTWQLREGVKWHDGQDFTAADVAFTFEYLSDPATNATTLGFYSDIASVEAVDDYTVLITFETPVAAWFNPFVGASGTILPEHVLRDFIGEEAAFAPFNLMPIGTGPYKVTQFNPGDVATYEIFMDYWDPGKPYFDSVELKGGGDAASAARAVLQTGEADWAWNLQVEATVLEQLESSGSGQLVVWPGAGTEKLVINHSDPETELDGQRSHRDVPHPHLSVLEVRQAIALAIPRDEIAEGLYGDTAVPTGYTLNENPAFMPPGITWEFDLAKAAALLDQAGAMPNADGLRELNGRPLRWVSSASTNSVRQKTQEIMKEAWAELGIELEIAAIEASVYFDAGNVDSFQHLYFDFGMERNSGGVFPINWYRRYLSADPLKDIAQQENSWSGRNFGRYQNPAFNELYAQAATTPDEADYIPIFWAMQQLVVDDVADIGLVSANSVAAAGEGLTGFEPSPFANDVWDIRNWRRE